MKMLLLSLACALLVGGCDSSDGGGSLAAAPVKEQRQSAGSQGTEDVVTRLVAKQILGEQVGKESPRLAVEVFSSIPRQKVASLISAAKRK